MVFFPAIAGVIQILCGDKISFCRDLLFPRGQLILPYFFIEKFVIGDILKLYVAKFE
uniref:Uncharacterized protein n=1 Tax=Firmicutes phage HS17 TaxID=3056395 RepID=A0AA49X4X1_9VIRU|nr:MAG: hypothetical protein [Firmicutes phage HS17]